MSELIGTEHVAVVAQDGSCPCHPVATHRTEP